MKMSESETPYCSQGRCLIELDLCPGVVPTSLSSPGILYIHGITSIEIGNKMNYITNRVLFYIVHSWRPCESLKLTVGRKDIMPNFIFHSSIFQLHSSTFLPTHKQFSEYISCLVTIFFLFSLIDMVLFLRRTKIISQFNQLQCFHEADKHLCCNAWQRMHM